MFAMDQKPGWTSLTKISDVGQDCIKFNYLYTLTPIQFDGIYIQRTCLGLQPVSWITEKYIWTAVEKIQVA